MQIPRALLPVAAAIAACSSAFFPTAASAQSASGLPPATLPPALALRIRLQQMALTPPGEAAAESGAAIKRRTEPLYTVVDLGGMQARAVTESERIVGSSGSPGDDSATYWSRAQ